MTSILGTQSIQHPNGTASATVHANGAFTAEGHVIGFKTVSSATSTQISSATFVDLSGMTLDYACKVSNSIVHIFVNTHVFIPQHAATWQTASIKILRDSTALYTDTGYGTGHHTNHANDRFMSVISVQASTSPGNTNTQTYKVQGSRMSGQSGSVDFNNASYGGGGRITVMEIAQ
tara:strand:- start:135 stop:662 length:528 start_codon:yes stop_codon:yes gene_type:complete